MAQRVLSHWDAMLPKFVKVMPVDYKKALEKMAREKQSVEAGAAAGELEVAGAK